MRRWILVALALAALAARLPRSTVAGTTHEVAARSTPSLPAAAPASTTRAINDRPRPASLRGTEVDGRLVLDADGRFRGDARAIRMFDYFLTTLGETDESGVRALVRAEAERALPDHVAEVLDLFDRYVEYRERLYGAAREPPGVADARAAALVFLERTVALQQQRFGAVLAERLFGDDVALARAILSGEESPLRAQVAAPETVRAQVAAMRAAGASDAEVWAVRAAEFGPEAADRLAELDRRRDP